MSTESCSSQAERTVSISGIWLDALSRYKAETGIDLKEEQAGEYRLLAECDSLESALRLTAGLVDAPSLAQASSWKQTQDSLCKVFKLVLVFNDATAELVASLQVPGGKAIFVALGILLKTAQNMQDRLSALADLLCNFDQFFRRLDVRRGIRYPVHDHEILTEICAEFLHVLALAQKIVGDRTPSRGPLGRLPRIRRHISNFREALLDNEDIKSAMRRLDNLTQMELQMTVAQTLHVAADSRVTLQDVQSTSRATLAIVREFLRRSTAQACPPDSTHVVRPGEAANSIASVLRLFSEYMEGDREKALFVMYCVLFTLLFPGNLGAIDRLRLAPLIALPFLALPRVLSLHDIITLVDVMGERRPICTDMWRNQKAFVEALRGFFVDNREVLKIIEAHQYRIQDAEYSVYKPGNSRVRSGTTLFMAAIFYRPSEVQLSCPWCLAEVSVSNGWNLQASFDCPVCVRKFSTSNSNSTIPRVAFTEDTLIEGPFTVPMTPPETNVTSSGNRGGDMALKRNGLLANSLRSTFDPNSRLPPKEPQPPSPADNHMITKTSFLGHTSFRFLHFMMMAPNVRGPPQYRTGKTLNRGRCVVVKEAVHIRTDKFYVCKVYDKNLMKGNEDLIRNEIRVMKRIRHPNTWNLHDYFETPINFYMCFDLYTGGNLHDRVANGKYPEAAAAKLVRTIFEVVAYIHTSGIVHRNLKAENVLFRTPTEDADIMIGGFHFSSIIPTHPGLLTAVSGTHGYEAPEILLESGHSKPVDVWAMGVTTYFLLSGSYPFDRDTRQAEREAIIAGDYRFEPNEYWADISDTARDFIKRCLTIDSDCRMTVVEALKHQWLAS